MSSSVRRLLVLAVLGWVYWPTLRELYRHLGQQSRILPRAARPAVRTLPALPSLHGSRCQLDQSVAVRRIQPRSSLAIAMRLVGSATSFLPLEGLSLIVCLAALAMLAGGRAGLARFWPPIVFLLFMIPLPYEASRLLGAELQRVGTVASTFLLQCFGQPAIAEGNRILIGDVTLNVVEACSGLRMLVTFLAFSVAAVLLMDRHWIVKGLVLGSAVPIAC